MKKLILVCALFFAAMSHISAQCLMYPVLLSQRIPQSDLVVEGKVIDQICFWNTEHNRIYTSNLVDVYKTFKNSGASYIEVITEGGTVGDKKHVLHPALNMRIGDVGVFTLIFNNQPAQFGKPVFEAYASAQGFIQYSLAENKAVEPFHTYNNISTDLYPAIQQLTGTSYIQVKAVNPFQQAVSAGNTTQAVAAITSFTPTTISAGTRSVLTINGTAFGATANAALIGFKNADNGGSNTISPIATEIVSWSNTQIQVRVPDGAGTGKITVNGSTSTGNLTIPYAHINVVNGGDAYMTKHISDGSGGYVWTYNTAFAANAPAKAAFERSMNSWRCNTYVNWTLASGTSAIDVATSDGVNIVSFDITLPSGVLGRCTNYFQGCINGSAQEWYVNELDIVFDPTPGTGTTWQYGPASPSGSQYDFESVSVHELGHGHELGHVINNADLMHYNIGTATTKRTINADDLAGGLAVMNRNAQSGGTCGEPLMTPLAPSACALGSFGAGISSSASSCQNQVIALSDASSGSPTSWSWSMPGGTPASATTQNTSVTYATAGAKVVSLTVTSGTASSTTSQTITVNPPPTLSVTPTATTVCPGQQVILKVSGATSYVWTPGGGSLPSFPVTPGATTTYSVVGTANSCSSAPTTIVVTVATCTGFEDLESHNELSVYPNPSTGIFTISSANNTGKLDVTVLNMLGQTVKTESSKDPKSVLLDMSTYSKGVYYVKVQMNDGAKLVKVILD
jgi:PKD repeat protein